MISIASGVRVWIATGPSSGTQLLPNFGDGGAGQAAAMG
jgi:hypothetical protein